MSEIKDFFDKLAPSWDDGAKGKENEIKALLGRLGIKKGDDVLDLACGTGVITSYLHDLSSNDVTGLDLSPKMIEMAKRKYLDKPWAHFEVGDFLSWSSLKLFDFIVVYNAYPHFLDPKVLSSCLAKKLRNGGKFAIVHSLGRKELDKHHSNVPCSISRNLLSPQEEALNFADGFKIDLTEEGENFYLLRGVKLGA
jgi:2-polyprenyl-3-methyl-5-hydroxy-6-metoxy-1,4-benzoquinol methylase